MWRGGMRPLRSSHSRVLVCVLCVFAVICREGGRMSVTLGGRSERCVCFCIMHTHTAGRYVARCMGACAKRVGLLVHARVSLKIAGVRECA